MENIKLRLWPSLRLILAADILSIPGGITPIKEINSPKKKMIVMPKN
jgi:hypothetical protein